MLSCSLYEVEYKDSIRIMKKAIFTLAIGDNPMYQAAILSFKHYAKKVGAELIISNQLNYPINIQNPKFNASAAWTEKLRIGELQEQFDRVLYMDADVLITPNARDVFELYPELDTVYWLDEGEVQARQNAVDLICAQLGSVTWPQHDGRPIYYNAGVILTSNSCRLFKETSLVDLQTVCNDISFYEQSYFNYTLHKHGIKHRSLDKSFNRMDMFGKEGYLGADFIHYAGKGYTKTSRRREIRFLSDFARLYKGIVDDKEISRLQALSWENYLNVVYKKYPFPNWLIKLCSEQFVSS